MSDGADGLDPTPFHAAYYASNGQAGDRPALRLYARLVSRYLRPARVLDVGCGTGALLARLARRRPADGLEISPYAADLARRRSPGSTVWSSSADLPTGTYDAFTAVHVLEHIPDDALVELLSDLRRATRPGARALVVVPDPSGRAAALRGATWNGWRDPTHVNLKSHAEWRRLFEEQGLRVEQQGSDGLWDFPYSHLPKAADAVRHGIPMALQFLLGRIILPPGSGESSFFVLSFGADTR